MNKFEIFRSKLLFIGGLTIEDKTITSEDLSFPIITECHVEYDINADDNIILVNTTMRVLDNNNTPFFNIDLMYQVDCELPAMINEEAVISECINYLQPQMSNILKISIEQCTQKEMLIENEMELA